jgi:hypothetical protein
MKIISMFVIICLVFPLSAGAESRFLGTKTSAIAFVVKMLVDRDREEVARLHERLGLPDRSVEFQEGFDHWRVEWYGSHVYIFRNGVLHREHPA